MSLVLERLQTHTHIVVYTRIVHTHIFVDFDHLDVGVDDFED